MEDKDEKVIKTVEIPETLHGASKIHFVITVLEEQIVKNHGKKIDIKWPANNELAGITGKIQIVDKEITYTLKESAEKIQIVKKEKDIKEGSLL